MLNLLASTKFGLNDATMALAAGAKYSGNWTLTYPNDATKISDIPANSYLVAFTVRLAAEPLSVSEPLTIGDRTVNEKSEDCAQFQQPEPAPRLCVRIK